MTDPATSHAPASHGRHVAAGRVAAGRVAGDEAAGTQVAGGQVAGGQGRHRARHRPGLSTLRLGLALTAAVAGTLALTAPSAPVTEPSSAQSSAQSAAPVPAPERGAPSAGSPGAGGDLTVTLGGSARRTIAAPVRVRMPSIGVDSRLAELGVDADGVLVPPADFGRAGWFAAGPVPGAVGPAVIAGHVDSYRGPAVFFRLGELATGATVLVDRADGSTARFRVRAVDRYPKEGFPTEKVYGPTPLAELRLITCGGTFDRDLRSYRDNVVVTAVLTT